MTEDLNGSRTGHISAITRLENATKDIWSKDAIVTFVEITKFECTLEKCREQQEKIEAVNAGILAALQNADSTPEAVENEQIKADESEFKATVFIHILEKFIKLANARSEAAESSGGEEETPISSRNSSLNIPKISSPTFSEKYNEWIPFHDLFKSTVDSNRSLSNIQKLHYLKSSLKEEPARLLAHSPISNSNYEVATKLLENRYANKRMIMQTHLGAIFNFKPIKMESADQLRKLVATYVENTMALEAMGLDNSSSDFIWLYLIGQKLDSETRRQWELHLKRDEDRTMGELIKFLEDRARALEFSNQSSATEKSKFSREKSEKREIQVHHQKSEISSACPKCSQKHAIYMCD